MRNSKKSINNLKLSFSKNLFDDTITEIRTMQNDLIGTIREYHRRDFEAQNIQNVKIRVCTLVDAEAFVLNSFMSLGKPLRKKKVSWQLALF